ncbi:MAG: ArnT family glycosyltransferase [Solirubrobacteraceae bacterium]
MATAAFKHPTPSTRDDGHHDPPPRGRPDPVAEGGHRLRWGLAIGGVLALALGLRLWGVKQGLPFAYNADENSHFVQHAVALFTHGPNPHYFNNPPAYTYLLYLIYGIYYGGGHPLSHTLASNPTEVFVIARVTAGVLGTIAVWLLYLCGRLLFDRRTALLAAGLLAVGFLPVFYAHLALNDVPTLAPVCLALWGTARILRSGRAIDYLIAAVGLGLAAATKYTGGIVLAPLVVAACVQMNPTRGGRSALIKLALAGVVAFAAFVIADPYALLDWQDFSNGILHQSAASDDATGKLGLTHGSGISYYLWTLTWGLGWVPAFGSLGGAVLLLRKDRRLAALLIPAAIIFLLFMGSQGRYFGRWLMPVLPIFCLLSAYFVLEAADWLAKVTLSELRPTLIALAVVALCGQAVVHSVHSGLVLSRSDTRNLARAWMVAHVGVGSHIVVEPVVPDQWAQDIGHVTAMTSTGYRWIKFPATRTQVAMDGSLVVGAGPVVNIENYERTLRPELVNLYQQNATPNAFCWVVSGSTQFGRAEVDPKQVPQAIAYYAELRRQGTLVFSSSPYAKGQGKVPFNFDWAFDYYPLNYSHPGPEMNIYKLSGGRCAVAGLTPGG